MAMLTSGPTLMPHRTLAIANQNMVCHRKIKRQVRTTCLELGLVAER